jgi:hypothetical protein
MRFIQLTDEQRQQLTLLYKIGLNHRQRAHALLLSERSYSIPDLADLFNLYPDTIIPSVAGWIAGRTG